MLEGNSILEAQRESSSRRTLSLFWLTFTLPNALSVVESLNGWGKDRWRQSPPLEGNYFRTSKSHFHSGCDCDSTSWNLIEVDSYLNRRLLLAKFGDNLTQNSHLISFLISIGRYTIHRRNICCRHWNSLGVPLQATQGKYLIEAIQTILIAPLLV